VDDQELLAITAIRDMNQEGAIAGSLMRSGWKVVYRATSPELLQENLARFVGAVLLLSDDFMHSEELQFDNTILLRGSAHPLGREGVVAPRNDFELGELIRNRKRESLPEKILIPATESSVIAIGSAQGGVGTSTLAINIADQLSMTGRKVILVDANALAPTIAVHFDIHDIRSRPRDYNSNFSLFEIFEVKQLLHLSTIASQYENVVIDCGPVGEPSFSGGRIHDQIFQWLTHSHSKFLLTSGHFRKSIDRTGFSLEKLREFAPKLSIDVAVILDGVTSRRDRMALEGDISKRLRTHVVTFTRDPKSIATSSEQAMTLQRSAPKSQLNREIRQYVLGNLIRK